MKRFLSVLAVALIVTGGVQARIIMHEITPANAERSGWRIEVAPDEVDRNLIRFTVWRGHKERTLKDGTTAQLVVRDGKRVISTSGLGLQTQDGKNVFIFSVTAAHLKDSRFELEILDVPFPSGDLYRIDLQQFHDARRKPGK